MPNPLICQNNVIYVQEQQKTKTKLVPLCCFYHFPLPPNANGSKPKYKTNTKAQSRQKALTNAVPEGQGRIHVVIDKHRHPWFALLEFCILFPEWTVNSVKESLTADLIQHVTLCCDYRLRIRYSILGSLFLSLSGILNLLYKIKSERAECFVLLINSRIISQIASLSFVLPTKPPVRKVSIEELDRQTEADREARARECKRKYTGMEEFDLVLDYVIEEKQKAQQQREAQLTESLEPDEWEKKYKEKFNINMKLLENTFTFSPDNMLFMDFLKNVLVNGGSMSVPNIFSFLKECDMIPFRCTSRNFTVYPWARHYMTGQVSYGDFSNLYITSYGRQWFLAHFLMRQFHLFKQKKIPTVEMINPNAL